MTKRYGKQTKEEYEELFKQYFSSTKEVYLNWCNANNFPAHIRKSPATFGRELAFRRKQEATEALYDSNKAVNTRSIIKLLGDGEKVPTGQVYNILSDFYKKSSLDRAELTRLLTHLERHTKLLESVDTLQMLLSLFTYDIFWVRKLENWKPKSHNKYRQFSTLARHFLAKYDVPMFLDKAWESDGLEIQREWYIHIGSGGNIRKAGHLPTPLTKKEAHHFLKTPAEYSINEAFVYGQVCALGGDERLVRALTNTPLVGSATDLPFRESLMKFFVDHPMLDTAQIGPIIDYIWGQKYQTTPIYDGPVIIRPVIIRYDPAPQPNFSMNGRTADALLVQVQRWHRQLGKEKRGPNATWTHSAYRDFELQEGSAKSKNVRVWRIVELCTASLLAAEGRAMHHCVASYAYSCCRGQCSIWSLSVEGKTGINRCLSLDISNKLIRQARGKLNRFPTQKERSILQRWCTREGLTISRWLQNAW